MGGDAETLGDPGDEIAGGVLLACGVSIENHWAETDAVLVASVGCAMKRPFKCFIFCEVLC